MTNWEWLEALANNSPDELSAWFDAEHVETEEQALDGDTEPENEDSRERLEAEIESYSAFDMMDTITLDMVIGWLDRQAAITAEETSNAWEEYRDATQLEIAKYEHDCELLFDKKRELTAERDKLEELNEYHALQYELASEDCDRLQAQVDRLTAERDELKGQVFTLKVECDDLTSACDDLENELHKAKAERDNLEAKCDGWKKHVMAIENAYKEALQWRDEYRSKFGKCLDYADAIHALMDDEGMA